MLGSSGWELAEARTIGQLWIAEIWLLRSTWSPVNFEVYLTFEVDAQGSSTEFGKEWFVRPSVSRPYDWFTEDSSEATEAVAHRDPISYLATAKDSDLQ